MAQFSGQAFHEQLIAGKPEVSAILWDAVEQGLENAFGEDKKRTKGAKRDKVSTFPPHAKGSGPGLKSRFGLLAEE